MNMKFWKKMSMQFTLELTKRYLAEIKRRDFTKEGVILYLEDTIDNLEKGIKKEKEL